MPAAAPEPPVDPPVTPGPPATAPGDPGRQRDPVPQRDAGGRRDPATDTRSDDDRDLGWGDDLDRADRGGRDARWYEEQRPPHWE